MQLEPYDEKAGYRCWLSQDEQEQIENYYSENLERQLAVELLLDGLRADEVIQVRKEDFRRMETEQEGWMLTIREGKTGHRECPVSASTKTTAYALTSAQSLHQDEPILSYTTKTIQNWVDEAAAHFAAEKEEWDYVTAHDLRRTWATFTYYQLAGDRAKQTVMSWGGWDSEQVFTSHYIGRVPDEIAISMMTEAGLV
ncbi:site-specific integrase [Salinirubellus salinus]|uniref:Site-specific integrase n=1 Tax=Salinirubellus salinus TaxID=1364945 RepID=A0A9E7U4B9_9EURY|nr:site-specific integrase [Salinirubellus salinus]UWM54120.1 site-specific integrase [Salinirubellus salinus]